MTLEIRPPTPDPRPATTAADLDPGMLAGRLTAGSIAKYHAAWAAYQRWCQAAGADPLRAASLGAYRDHLAADTALSPNSIHLQLAAVRRILKDAAAHRLIDEAEAERFARVEGVKVSALRARLKTDARTRIEPADMRRLAEAPDRGTLKGQRDAALLAVLAGSGLRAHEAAGSHVADIRTLPEAKGKDGRPRPPAYVLAVLGKGRETKEDAPLTTEAYTLIRAWLGARPVPSPYIFTGFAGRGTGRATAAPLTPVAIWQIVRAYAVAVGLAHIKPHDLRRFCGTQIYQQTGDIRKAQKALRHKSIETTARNYILDQQERGITEGLY